MAESLSLDAERLDSSTEHRGTKEDRNSGLRDLEDCGYNVSAHNWLERKYWWVQYHHYLQTLMTCHFLVNRSGLSQQGGGAECGTRNQAVPPSQQQQQQQAQRGWTNRGIIGKLCVYT